MLAQTTQILNRPLKQDLSNFESSTKAGPLYTHQEMSCYFLQRSELYHITYNKSTPSVCVYIISFDEFVCQPLDRFYIFAFDILYKHSFHRFSIFHIVLQNIVVISTNNIGKGRRNMHINIKQILEGALRIICSNITVYCRTPGKDFTRDRKLLAYTLMQFMLNMEGNSLNAEIYNNFPVSKERMTASAYEQRRQGTVPMSFR